MQQQRAYFLQLSGFPSDRLFKAVELSLLDGLTIATNTTHNKTKRKICSLMYVIIFLCVNSIKTSRLQILVVNHRPSYDNVKM